MELCGPAGVQLASILFMVLSEQVLSDLSMWNADFRRFCPAALSLRFSALMGGDRHLVDS
jgi:hypothetical protein